MADLDRNTNWNANITQDAKIKTYTFSTKDKYVDKDIALKIDVQQTVYEKSGDVQIENGTVDNDNTSGVKITGIGIINHTQAGWMGKTMTSGSATKYLKSVTMTNGKSLEINDGIYNWTLSVDANGNVSLT